MLEDAWLVVLLIIGEWFIILVDEVEVAKSLNRLTHSSKPVWELSQN